jgi:serine/threonine protein phosphatase PrpC
MIQDPDIERALRAHPDPVEASAELVRLANEAGGRDNITVVLFRIGRA